MRAGAVVDGWLEKAAEAGIKTRRQVSGAELTTFSIGGPVAVLFEPHSMEELAAIGAIAQGFGRFPRIIGAGSNILIPDDGINSALIMLGKGFKTCTATGDGGFIAGGAASVMTLSRDLSRSGFGGLEFAGGIPGTIGGAVRMNAGAHGGNFSEIVRSVKLFDSISGFRELKKDELDFGYRRSGIKDGCIITEVSIKLEAGSGVDILKKREEMLKERRSRQPLTHASAGSIFKNPEGGLPAGALIEKCGLKGMRKGGAKISEIHANWIVNDTRKATASDVKGLIDLCREAVLKNFSIDLQLELAVW